MRSPVASSSGRQTIRSAPTAALLLTAALVQAALAQPAQRGVEPVVLKGSKVAGWSGPSATIVCDLFPAGGLTGERDAHAGTLVTPPATGIPVDEVAAYRWDGAQFVEIPVQVDEKYFYCLSNPPSEFAWAILLPDEAIRY